jgi:hypothetical protein
MAAGHDLLQGRHGKIGRAHEDQTQRHEQYFFWESRVETMRAALFRISRGFAGFVN